MKFFTSETKLLTLLLIGLCILFLLGHMDYLQGTIPADKDYNSVIKYMRENASSHNPDLIDNDCMTTLDACLTLIQRTSGLKPERLSYRIKDHKARSTHPITGQPFKVPNIVHLISFGDQQPFLLYNYVAFKSYDKYLSPLAIFLWADHPPAKNNIWWNQTLQEVDNVYFVPTLPVKRIGGRNVSFIAHAADYLRLQLIKGTFICFFLLLRILLLKTKAAASITQEL